MPGARPPEPGWSDVVRARHASTTGLVVAVSGTCLKIQRDEAELVTGRSFRPIHPRDLPEVDLGPSSFVVVLFCPGDTTEDLARWARGLPKTDLRRIRFYGAPGVRFKAALAAWTAAGLPELPRFRISGFRSFHKLFGRHHADRVYVDATRSPTG